MEKRRSPEVIGPQRERITRLSTLALVQEIATQAALLIKKQVELARTELKADARREAQVAGGLGIAAIGAIMNAATSSARSTAELRRPRI